MSIFSKSGGSVSKGQPMTQYYFELIDFCLFDLTAYKVMSKPTFNPLKIHRRTGPVFASHDYSSTAAGVVCSSSISASGTPSANVLLMTESGKKGDKSKTHLRGCMRTVNLRHFCTSSKTKPVR